MDKPHLGSVIVDRLARGWKVSVFLRNPSTGRDQPLDQPDHFATYSAARRFADRVASAMSLELVDRSREAANVA